MRFFPWTLIFLLPCIYLSGQSPSYVHYGVSEGLPSNLVYCAFQDHRGFVWFGTDKGLARFDGKHFQVYGVKEGLPDPEVLVLFEDSQNRLWITCFSQKPCYMQNGRFYTSKNDSLLAQIDSEAGLWVYSEDTAHRVWISSRTHNAYLFDGKSIRKIEYPAVITRVEQIGDYMFALGTVTIIQKELGLNYMVYPQQKFLKSSVCSGNHILYSVAGQLILLEWTGNQMIERDRISFAEGGVFKDYQGRFWHCPDSKGAVCFGNSKKDLSNQVKYLPEEKVNAVMENRHGTLWFCTSGHGVYALSPGKAATFTTANGFVTNNITAIARDEHGQILVGDDYGNIYHFNGSSIQKTLIGPADEYNRCRQIIPLPGGVWVANDKGLCLQQGSAIHRMPGKVGPVSGLKTILAQPRKLWYGSHSAVGFITPDLQNIVKVGRRTTVLGHDASDNIWAGSLDGLYSQRDSFQHNWGDEFPALKARILAIQQAGADKIWVVTPEDGLLLATVRQGTLTEVRKINPLLKQPINSIQALFVEPVVNGRVWMATNSGVYCLNPLDWRVIHFDQHDGLADNDVNCILVASDTLWVGSAGGLSFFPLSARSGANDFSTFITGVHYQAANRPVFLNLLDSLYAVHQVVLPADAAMTTLNLAGLNYRSQGNLVYECITTEMLPPVLWWTRHNLYNCLKNSFRSVPDTTLIEADNLSFGLSLASGSYHLRITAITTEGVASRNPDEWTLVMQPYWYNTVWIDLLIWGLVIYAIWRSLRVRNIHRKLTAAVSELQLQTLQSQINPHFVGNSINAIQQFFYPPNPAAASNYVELFTRLLRRTILLSEQHFNSFEEELAYDRDYLQMIELRFGERFQYQIEGAGTVPAGLPFPSMLLQPILENATIHGLAAEGISYLRLEFQYSNRDLRCTITDNGMGYKVSKARPSSKPVEHKSKGLELLQKKVLAFNQLYDIGLRLELSDLSEAEPSGRGTQVIIAFNTEKIKQA